ncbi:16S rRNA (guanine527-N7)-methyltransferase [Lishizhenia tianjinensis]|uniref:Ribosomal RNA small subunit methyltransferase G n=1 Tax=Lishizhenia tianjinensis TaxID=477690 RepID=A0A1I7BK95_9FLAO|nr:16S rRNA (guanine(527)-N(7))-methyltransferase RsmG [Lishizhenia tianjinensis]SFT87596.1 16S rRNA (guanine527-N7)-methyltransferase [Lishizhenia tianjinensis]
MNNEQLILSYFPDLTQKQIEQFAALGDLYQEWNEKINVISRKDVDNFYERHVLHSLGIAKVIQFKKGTRLLDVGCGGGFPGIPLAILFPECEFHLVDSIGKKIKVVQEVAEAIGLTNLQATHARAEQIKDKYDFVISRAVTAMPKFLQWITNKFDKQDKNAYPNGVFYLKGGDLKEEMKPVKRHTEYFDLADYFEGEFFETKKVVYVRMN